jgi:hypothetical protein
MSAVSLWRHKILQIARRHTEYALDAFRISDADLNMRLLAKASVLVYGMTFLKNTPHRIEGLKTASFLIV